MDRPEPYPLVRKGKGWAKGVPRARGSGRGGGSVGVNNKHGLTTIYVPDNPQDRALWVEGRQRAIRRGLSMSRYVLTLVREDLQRELAERSDDHAEP